MSYLYTFNLTHAESVSVSQPFFTLSDLSSNDTLKITATSMAKTCEIDFDVHFLEDSTEIVHKK